MSEPPHEIHIALADFDRSKLPESQRSLSGEPFRLAVREHFQREFSSSGGTAQIIVTDDSITIRWDKSTSTGSWTDRGIERLQAGDYEQGIALLERSIHQNPDDTNALFNLGMALSDKGRMGDAIRHLEHLLSLSPKHGHGLVALGVARARANDFLGAISALRQAVEVDGDDGYARKNLGALIAQSGQNLDEALNHLEAASRLLPEDVQVWFNLGLLQEKIGDLEAADRSYQKVLGIERGSRIAQAAEEGRSRIAQRVFRDKGGQVRPDALAYCLDALDRFRTMQKQQVQQIAFEIAMLGTRGIDVNDPAQKYTLRTITGRFSGLHLLCLEYVGFKTVDPTVDIGFDLSREYEEAKRLSEAKNG